MDICFDVFALNYYNSDFLKLPGCPSVCSPLSKETGKTIIPNGFLQWPLLEKHHCSDMSPHISTSRKQETADDRNIFQPPQVTGDF